MVSIKNTFIDAYCIAKVYGCEITKTYRAWEGIGAMSFYKKKKKKRRKIQDGAHELFRELWVLREIVWRNFKIIKKKKRWSC